MEDQVLTPTELLIEKISEHLQEVNDDEVERMKRITDILDFVMWNKRITELTPKEKEAFASAMQGGVSDHEREVIKNAKDEKTKDYHIDSFARANYFRKCAWISYLSGEGTKPIIV